MSRTLLSIVSLLALGASGALGQATLPPTWSQATIATGIPAATAMSISPSGDVWIGHAAALQPDTVTHVSPSGAVNSITVPGDLHALERDPENGHVLAVWSAPNVGGGTDVFLSDLDQSGFATSITAAPLSLPAGAFVGGFAADIFGPFYLGTSQGIFRLESKQAGWQFWHPGIGLNRVLGAQVDRTVLVGDGATIWRVVEGTNQVVSHYTAPVGGVWQCVALPRANANAFGAGIVAGFRITNNGAFEYRAVGLDRSGMPNGLQISEPLATLEGFHTTGFVQETWWLTNGSLRRFLPITQPGDAGGMLASINSAANTISFDLWAAPHAPFLLGADIAGSTFYVPYVTLFGIYVPVLGLFHTGPNITPTFVPVVDGYGLYTGGTPDPRAFMDSTGHRHLQFSLPATPQGVNFALEAYIFNPSAAPNGVAFITHPTVISL